MKTQVMKFLGDVNTPVAFATTSEANPKVRFFSFKMVEEGELYFITSKEKNVFKELEKNNKVELCSLPNEEKNWIRVAANVEFINDLELKKKAFNLLPLLEKAYGDPSNEKIVLLKMTDMNIRKYGLLGEIERLEF